MTQATPTHHPSATLIRHDGTAVNVPSVEFFTRRRMIWVRGHDISPGSLKEVVIDGVAHAVRSIENKESLCEILLASE